MLLRLFQNLTGGFEIARVLNDENWMPRGLVITKPAGHRGGVCLEAHTIEFCAFGNGPDCRQES
jgi:hypothetical protein